MIWMCKTSISFPMLLCLQFENLVKSFIQPNVFCFATELVLYKQVLENDIVNVNPESICCTCKKDNKSNCKLDFQLAARLHF